MLMRIGDRPDDAILTAALEMMADGIIVFDQQGNIAYTNDTVGQHLYCPASAWQAVNAFELVASDEVARFRFLISQVRQDGPVRTGDFRLQDSGGNEFPAQIAIRILEDGRHLALIRDISEQICRRRGFQDCDSPLLQFIEYNPAPVAMFDRNMRYLAVSRQFMSQYGLEDREIIGLSHYEVFPDLPERWQGEHQRGLAGEVVCCEEDAFPRADGHMDWVRWEIRPWWDAQGGIGGIIIYSEIITARKLDAQRLRESEENFRIIVNESPLPVTVTRIEDGKVLYANDRAMRLFQLSQETLQNLFASNFYVNPEKRREVADKIREVGYLQDHELQLKKADGTLLWATVAVQPVTQMGERCWLTIFQDITERKLANELLGEAERMAKFGAYRFDVAKGTWQSSEVLDEIFGIGTNYVRDFDGWLHLVHPEDREAIRDHLQQHVLTECNPFHQEYRIIRASDGVERWVHGQGSLKLDSNDRPYLLFGSIQDITEYKQASARIDMFRQAIDQAGEAILITDNHGDIEYVNSAFTRITGYSSAEAIGQNPRMLNSGNQDKTFYRKMWETIVSGQTWQGRVIDKRKDGSFYPCLLSISAMHDADGQISHFIGIQQDLQEYEELERQFYQSQKMEALGILVGGIAHDFNNTLAGITGNLYLARKEAAAYPRLLDRLKSMETLAFRAAGMIQQLLAFSRKGVLEMRPLSIAPFLKEAAKLHRVSLPENIGLKCDIRDGSMIVRGDPNLLQQALMNLINNARDAVQDVHQPCITITLDRFRPDGAFLKRHPGTKGCVFAHMRICDNGGGIQPEHVEHIFEPFFTTKEQDKGTGLGLAMVYGAMQSHGGIITADSIEGEGAHFDLYLPLFKDEAGGRAPEDEGEAQHGHGELILLADDDLDVLTMMREVLENLGYRVITANDGLMAVDMYRAHRSEIRLLIMDMVMPKLDGPGAYRIIRELDPGVNVLFATGYDMGVLSQIPDIGRDQIMTKPYTVVDLGRRVQWLLADAVP